MGEILCRRIYDQPEKADGFRILVDRLWPRGMKKERAGIDLWAKELAPSTDLRLWFGYAPERFSEFRTRYLAELNANPNAAEFLKAVRNGLLTGNVTLLYGARNTVCNHAIVIKDWLEKDLGA